jgi:thiol-disulfide isomerase/thioredoxin
MSTPPDPSSQPGDSTASSTTRRALLALVGLGAAAGGAWWALRRGAPSATQQPGAGTAASAQATAGEPLPPGFWTQQFDTPAGTPLNLATFQGKPLLVNFWATWCPPCVKELPELDRFHQAFGAQGGQVLGLAIDAPTPVKAFLGKTKVAFPIGLAGMGGTETAAALGNSAGGLPFSVLISAQGRIVQRKMGATSFEELSTWARELG